VVGTKLGTVSRGEPFRRDNPRLAYPCRQYRNTLLSGSITLVAISLALRRFMLIWHAVRSARVLDQKLLLDLPNPKPQPQGG